MRTLSEPVFCLTTDVDWASDFALSEHLDWMADMGIRPTVFATHATPVLDDFLSRGAGEVGLHPNFLPGSSHGASFDEVIDHIHGLFPMAKSFRSHTSFDAAAVACGMLRRGIFYDSNLGLYLQPNVVPMRHGTGLVRYPLVWEEDLHWHNVGPDWDVDKYLPLFLTPGLKVLNCHPFMVQTNCPHHDYYQSIKGHITTLDRERLATTRFPGAGCQTFLASLISKLLERGFRFHTLSELYEKYPIRDFLPPEHPDHSSNLLQRAYFVALDRSGTGARPARIN